MENDKGTGPNPSRWGKIVGLWITLLVMVLLTALVIKAVQYINLW